MDNPILNKSFNFSVKIIRLYQGLIAEKKEYNLSKQILRSATSIGANVEEAIGGLSKKDFAAKMGIAYKEARETHYWLRLLHATDYIDTHQYESLLKDCDEILKILFSIIRTAKS